ncbi:cytosine permease [Siminovitchia sp. FSL H7-0308]|uniref:purine-cytosine permease family protein n=1 Tax=Siminovitchia sp. FSL H7-0308 TaxID=2921432 RepID=UPI0030ECD677
MGDTAVKKTIATTNESNVIKSEEYYSTNPIPYKDRKSWLGVAAIFFGMTAAISSFATGGGLIVNLTLTQALLSLGIATAILLCLFYIPMGVIGAKEGLNTYMVGEAAFGKKGTNIATGMVIGALPAFGWYGVQVSIAAEALNQAFGGHTNLVPLFMIIIGLLFVVPALFGITSIAWLDYVSIPAILGITILGVIKVFNTSDLSHVLSYQPATTESLFWGINIVIGSMVAGASFAPDYTRWTHPKVSSVSLSGIVGIVAPLIILTLIGAMMALTATTLGVDEPWNISQVLSVLGLPAIALIFVILLQWTTNIVAAYSAGLALTKAFGWSRFWWTLIVAIVGTALSIFGIVKFFLLFLGLLAVFVSPVAGVLISEYFFVSKGQFNRKEGFYWPGIITWLIGGFVAYLIPYFIPAVNGFIISFVLYTVYHKFIKKTPNEKVAE